MRRKYSLIAMLVIAPASCPAQILQAPTAVRLTVSTDKRTYKTGEKITALYQLQNVSKRKIFVPVRFSTDCAFKSGWTTGIRAETGKLVSNGIVGDCMPHSFPTYVEKLKADSKLLSPGDQYAPEETFETKGLEPGIYRVTARVTAWKNTDFTVADKEELRQFGVPVLTGTLTASVTVRLTR